MIPSIDLQGKRWYSGVAVQYMDPCTFAFLYCSKFVAIVTILLLILSNTKTAYDGRFLFVLVYKKSSGL